MVLQLVYGAVTTVIPIKYWPHALVISTTLAVIYAYVQGRQTTRERDLHARVILLTGPFTPLGLVTLTALAKRGAHIIALSPYSLSHPIPSLLLPLIRSTTNNENIYAEQCDLNSPTSIRKFCTTFLTGQETRLDALVFAHEYPSIGRIWFFGGKARHDKEEREQAQRETSSLASFLLTTLLLPALLVAPVERDIRIVHVINPFYAAALPTFPAFLNSTAASPPLSQPLIISEGLRALRAVVLSRHLQRILDSLPNRAADPKSKSQLSTEPHPSNILSVAACPGISRRDTVAPFLGANENGWSLAYLVLLLPLFLLTKTSGAALQTLLHVLFLPTPFKRAQAKVDAAADEERKAEEERVASAEASKVELEGDEEQPRRTGTVEVLKPGALYRECAVVPLDVPRPPAPVVDEKNRKGTAKKSKDDAPETALEDDEDYGGEAVGRAVWEWYEARLKTWEALDAARVKAAGETTAQEKTEAATGTEETSVAEMQDEQAASEPTVSAQTP
ncbi:hypothetical protein BC628DRAFT_1515255 [Trametes gibbosa]|nr:hypothetical protein BC628DRAFT_1515255 [Trametes gibbosa]